MRCLAPLVLFALSLPAAAETLSAEIARTGLAATEARLVAAARTPEETFTLGGVQFLRAVEISFQDRWAVGLTDRTGMLPFLRLPVTVNPAAAPFDPAVIAGIFRHAGDQLALSQATLASLPPDADFGAEIALADLWFDMNRSATRDPGEGLIEVLGTALFGGGDPASPAPTVRFDAADAAWLSAYSHALMGICELVLAYDPTEPITRIAAARRAMDAMGTVAPDFILGSASALDALDMLAMFVAALDQTPDTERMAAAHRHFLAMVNENRRFWRLVAQETDDAREWLPNAAQHSALGVILPPQTAGVWQGVLADAEAILLGTRLVPYWQLEGPVGVNVAKIFTEPRPIDLFGWVQGWAALPYLEQGTVISSQNWSAFESLMAGDAMLMALWLN